jgi:hypothetical protein
MAVCIFVFVVYPPTSGPPLAVMLKVGAVEVCLTPLKQVSGAVINEEFDFCFSQRYAPHPLQSSVDGSTEAWWGGGGGVNVNY